MAATATLPFGKHARANHMLCAKNAKTKGILMNVNCSHCGRGFKAQRSTAKYCSGKCRANAALVSKRRAPALTLAVDPDPVDPRAIYAAIAMDPTASASARIQAAKALAATQKAPQNSGFNLNARAARILAAGRRLN
jgi:hypothetical protein